MIKQYISLLEIMPIIISNTQKHKEFASYADILYSYLPNADHEYYDQAKSIVVSSYLSTVNCECALLQMGHITENATLPSYNIPHVLELEYLKQSDMEFSDIEMDMLHCTSTMLLLQYLASLDASEEDELSDAFGTAKDKLAAGVIFNDHIHTFDTEENPTQVEAIIHNLYTNYDIVDTIPAMYTNTGLAKSTYDIQQIFYNILCESTTNYRTYQHAIMFKCLRYAPLYTIFTVLEQTEEKTSIPYCHYLEYRIVYDGQFQKYAPHEDESEQWQFSNGALSRDNIHPKQDTVFLRRMMSYAVTTMESSVVNSVVPCTNLLENQNIKLLASSTVSVLLSYPTLKW